MTFFFFNFLVFLKINFIYLFDCFPLWIFFSAYCFTCECRLQIRIHFAPAESSLCQQILPLLDCFPHFRFFLGFPAGLRLISNFPSNFLWIDRQVTGSRTLKGTALPYSKNSFPLASEGWLNLQVTGHNEFVIWFHQCFLRLVDLYFMHFSYSRIIPVGYR